MTTLAPNEKRAVLTAGLDGQSSRKRNISFTDTGTVHLRAKILDIRGFDSSIILTLQAGILMSTGNFPEMLSQQILVETPVSPCAQHLSQEMLGAPVRGPLIKSLYTCVYVIHI